MLAHTDDPHWAQLETLHLELGKVIDQAELSQDKVAAPTEAPG